MGWKSTVAVSREDGELRIAEGLQDATNEQIAGALEAMFGDQEGANYKIGNTCVECGALATNTLGSHCEEHEHMVF